MPLVFAEPLLMRTITCKERVYRLQHYSQVVAAYITMPEICSLTLLTTGLPGTHRDGVAYQLWQYYTRVYYCKKYNVCLHAECFEIYHCKRAVCKVYLR